MPNDFSFWLVFLGGIVLLIAIALIARFVVVFQKDVRYVRLEINRADSWDEYVHWKHELRYLRLSILPGLTPDRARRMVNFFHRKLFHKKKKSDGLYSLLAPSLIGMGVLTACLIASTYAWFTSNTHTQAALIQSAEFDVSVSITEVCSGDEIAVTDKSAQLVDGTAYRVTVNVSDTSTASAGYCRITSDAEETVFYTKTLFTHPNAQGEQTDTVSFVFYARESGSYLFDGVWGNCLATQPINEGDFVGTPYHAVLTTALAENTSETPYSMRSGTILFDVLNHDGETVSEKDVTFEVYLDDVLLTEPASLTIEKDAKNEARVRLTELTVGLHKVTVKSLTCCYCAHSGCHCDADCLCGTDGLCQKTRTLYFYVEPPFFTVTAEDHWVKLDVYTLSSGEDISITYSGCVADPTDTRTIGWDGSGTFSVLPYAHQSFIFLNADDTVSFVLTQNGIPLEEKEP